MSGPRGGLPRRPPTAPRARPNVVGGPSGEEMSVANARWTAPDGVVHTGVVPMLSGAEAGTGTTIWVDDAGALAPRPLTASDAVVLAILSGVGVAVFGGSLLLCALLAVRGVSGALNARRWEREWARLGPEWTSTQR